MDSFFLGRLQHFLTSGPGEHSGRLGGRRQEGRSVKEELLRVGVRALLSTAGGW